jgi:hypothetical protein
MPLAAPVMMAVLPSSNFIQMKILRINLSVQSSGV